MGSRKETPRRSGAFLGYYRERTRPCARMDVLRHEFGRLDPAVTALTLAPLWHLCHRLQGTATVAGGGLMQLCVGMEMGDGALAVAVIEGLVHRPHDLDVLLRHRLLPQPGGFEAAAMS